MSRTRSARGERRLALFLSGGIGDAVQVLPLVRQLVAAGRTVDILHLGRWGGHHFYEMLDLPGTRVLDQGRRINRLFRDFQGYDEIYVDRASASWRNILLGAWKGRQAHILRSLGSIHRLGPCRFHGLRPNVHFLHQNLTLWPASQPLDLDRDFYSVLSVLPSLGRFDLPSRYVVVQPGSANMLVKYKNWPISYWRDLLVEVKGHYPGLPFVILGDSNETSLGRSLEDPNLGSINLVGKTTLKEAIALIAGADAYLGQDSGLMHVAAALGRPTFTIWGASDPGTIGYEVLNPDHHVDIRLPVRCAPCYSLSNPNKSRVTDAKRCPDYRCLTDLEPKIVLGHFEDFARRPSLSS